MSGWRERTGVEMWAVANLATCYSPFRRRQLRELAAACHDALAGLPHDHCARFLVHVEAESYALLGDKKAFLESWQRHKSYFDGRLEKSEWFQATRRHLLADIPAMAHTLQEDRKSQYRKLLWQLRREHLFARLRGIKFFPKRFRVRWLLWGIWLLWVLSRILQNS